jgi:hypothetical protein
LNAHQLILDVNVGVWLLPLYHFYLMHSIYGKYIILLYPIRLYWTLRSRSNIVSLLVHLTLQFWRVTSWRHCLPSSSWILGGRSGYPKISGRIIWVFKILGFENRYPKLQRVLQYPKIWVPEISGSGSGIPELPELLCWLHENIYTLLN